MGKMKHSEKNVSQCPYLTQMPHEETQFLSYESKVGHAIKHMILNECIIYHVLDKLQY
jgi:hypothetical protein